ncbi:LuxR family transcriptional regulator [Thalassotalea euphylliae]|uniref:LuxR family transcriptional regulator n=1 Tax=Thalassotalea euphylliae TaxID=1655234 RepID=A0A3E0TNQ4_9GAMM|nr:autoinducer binding domain-containing protein [Thalassotalea euphylliae]REL26196.1 LuxR family transcriptional regulator [Thalassotalea euphylliae]
MTPVFSTSFFQTLQEMTHVSTESELFKHLKSAIHYLEFDYYAYGLCIASPVTRPTFTLRNNYPEQWQHRYEKNQYIHIDPTVAHGLQSTRPLAWSGQKKRSKKAFWQEAEAYGLKSGWAQSALLKPGATGMLTVATNDQSPLSQAKQLHLLSLSNTFQSVYGELVVPHKTTTHDVKLTKREKEILKWCADGKTSDEIAMILNVTKSTVSFHLANAVNKLGVCNKTAAAVKAIQYNLL